MSATVVQLNTFLADETRPLSKLLPAVFIELLGPVGAVSSFVLYGGNIKFIVLFRQMALRVCEIRILVVIQFCFSFSLLKVLPALVAKKQTEN